jgi:hypothetical protein
MALQTEQVHIAHPKHVNVRASVRNMARRAPLNLHWLVLEDKWPLLVGMAAKANRILRRCMPHLFRQNRSVDVVTVATVNQPLINAVVERHLELRPLLQMAGIAKLRLGFYQQELSSFRVVRRVTGNAANAILGVHRVDGVHVLRPTRVTTYSLGGDLAIYLCSISLSYLTIKLARTGPP